MPFGNVCAARFYYTIFCDGIKQNNEFVWAFLKNTPVGKTDLSVNCEALFEASRGAIFIRPHRQPNCVAGIFALFNVKVNRYIVFSANFVLQNYSVKYSTVQMVTATTIFTDCGYILIVLPTYKSNFQKQLGLAPG